LNKASQIDIKTKVDDLRFTETLEENEAEVDTQKEIYKVKDDLVSATLWCLHILVTVDESWAEVEV
jgi:hypothetical protein